MTRLCLGAFLCMLALMVPLGSIQEPPPPAGSEEYKTVLALLEQARQAFTEQDAKTAAELLAAAAEKIRGLADRKLELREPLNRLAERLLRLARELPPREGRFPLDDYLAELRELRHHFEPPAGSGLRFQGAYRGAKTVEQAGGGHASAMGPAPPQLSSLDDLRDIGETLPFVIDFVEVAVINEKTFCGGPSKDHILESGGSGVALFDFDNDGWLDIYVVNAYELAAGRKPVPHRNALYRNLGNWKFENVAEVAGVDAAVWGNGVCVADYDSDGYLDLYVTNFGPNLLFRNRGDGTFTEVAREAGVDHPGWSTGCAFFDADGDGDLDLYLANYVTTSWEELLAARRTFVWRGGPQVMFGPTGLPGSTDAFYLNQGNGKFIRAGREAGFDDTEAFYGFAVLAADYDRDGWIDLYVANDSNPNLLYHNLGKGRFESAGTTSGVALNADGRAQAGMGVDAADFDGDGLLDLVVTNFAHDTNTLYRNLGKGQFEDATRTSGLHARTFKRLGWGVAFLDTDRDGQVDLFFANGHIYPQVDEHPELEETFHQKNQLLLNRGGSFLDVSEKAGSGLQVLKSSRGLAVGDLDNDGDLDLVITNIDDLPTVLENRSRTLHHWVGLKLRKQGSNPFCIGARVTLRAGGRTQIREVRSGGGYLSQNDLRVYFGLGAFSGKVDVEVELPGKQRRLFKDIQVDQITELAIGV